MSFMFQRYRIQMQLRAGFIQIPLIIMIILQVNFIFFNAKKKYLKHFTYCLWIPREFKQRVISLIDDMQ